MSRQCSLASHAEMACDNLSLQSLCPFFGDPCDDSSMHVCAAEQLNDFLSSHPLTTIRHTKYGKQRQKCEYCHCRCGCAFCINVCYSVDALFSWWSNLPCYCGYHSWWPLWCGWKSWQGSGITDWCFNYWALLCKELWSTSYYIWASSPKHSWL